MAGRQNTYSFTSRGLSPDTFQVVRFKGVEGLSIPYEFDILLVSREKDLDLKDLVNRDAVFTLTRKQGNLPYHGVPALFERQNQYQGHVFYRVVLAPKLRWLAQTHHNQIFLDQDLQGFLTQALVDGGLKEGRDFEFRLQKTYPKREYVCQYRESHFNFVSRWMERDGLYYFFEQEDSGAKMVITDAKTVHKPMAGAPSLKYLPESGLGEPKAEESVQRFVRKTGQTPQRVTLADYNYRQPGTPLTGRGLVSQHGLGEQKAYGDHFQSASEGDHVAKVRAEEQTCRKQTFSGLASSPFIRPGALFPLDNHFRDDLNATYLVVRSRHEGGQEGYLADILGVSPQVLNPARRKKASDRPYYRNAFTAIPADVQFRPRRKAVKPRIYGVMNAKVDASQSGQYAELDDQGRYKVILPFDLSGKEGGKASSWLRMLQPYGGPNMGFHFPLHKGTEVLLTFIDGDPDRPVIQAAVPNPDHKSLLTSENNTKCMLTTSGGNKLHIEDKKGSERILCTSPTQNSWVRGGQPNDPPSSWSEADDQLGWKLNSDGGMKIRAGLYDSMVIGASSSWRVGNYTKTVAGLCNEFIGFKTALGLAFTQEFNFLTLIMKVVRQRATGTYVAVNDNCVKLAGTLQKIQTQRTELQEVRDELAAQKNELNLSKQRLSETEQRLQAAKERLAETKETIAGDIQKLNGDKTQLTESKTRMGGEIQRIEGQKSKMNQNITAMQGANQVIQGQKEMLTETTSKVAGFHDVLVGFQELT